MADQFSNNIDSSCSKHGRLHMMFEDGATWCEACVRESLPEAPARKVRLLDERIDRVTEKVRGVVATIEVCPHGCWHVTKATAEAIAEAIKDDLAKVEVF